MLPSKVKEAILTGAVQPPANRTRWSYHIVILVSDSQIMRR